MRLKSFYLFTLHGLCLSLPAEEIEYLLYEDFIKQVEDGDVASVTLNQFSTITGESNREPGKKFRSYRDTGSANDPLLNRLLIEHGVEVKISDAENQSGMLYPTVSGLLFLLTPILMLGLLITILVKTNRILTLQKKVQTPTETTHGTEKTGIQF